MINQYQIKRFSKTVYVVAIGDKVVKKFTTYKECEDYVFNKQSEELMYGYDDTLQATG